MALFWRVFTTIAAVNAGCLVVLFVLASVQYDAVLSGLMRDRLAVIAAELATPFQAAADLGLPIESLRDVDTLLLRTKQSSPGILGIYIFDPAGGIVRLTEPTVLPEIAGAMQAAMAQQGTEAAFADVSGALLVTSTIKGVDGAIAGSIVIQYSLDEKALQVRALAGRLGFIATVTLIASLCASLVVMRVSLARHIRLFDGLLATYDRFERQAWRGRRQGETEMEPIRGFGIDTGDMFTLLQESEARYQAVNPTHQIAPPRAQTS